MKCADSDKSSGAADRNQTEDRRKIMTPTKFILNSAALIALSVPAAFAHQTIQERKENQQDRIANGVQSGQLTAGETKNLETKEVAVNKEEHNMRAADNGKLTAADRAKLNHQQNKLSKDIYNKKHNAKTQ
jgi:methionine-rich copper-binding protein CopC